MSEDGFRIASAYVQVNADDEGFHAELESKVKAASEGTAAKVHVEADAEGLEAEVKAAAEAAHAEAHVAVKVDQSGGGDFETAFRQAMQEGQKVSDSAAADLRNSYSAVQNASVALRQSMEDVDDTTKNTGKSLNDAGEKAANSKSGFDQLKSAADTTGTALKIVSMISLAPSLGAIPGIAAGAVGGLATLALGLGSVVKVLREAGQASDSMGQSGAQMALTAFNDAVAIRNANQAISDAERQAAQQAISSAESIANAKRGVTDAVRQAAQQQISSAEQVANAEQSLGDAQRQAAIAAQNSADSEVAASQRAQAALVSQAQAQRDLTLAQQDAANQIADLNNANADAALSSQAAQLALQQAQRNDKATQSDSLATQLQKEQSTLSVAQAQQALVDAQQRSTEAQQAATRANTEGVTGLPAVVDAQQKLRDAVIAVADANHAVVIANRDAANQQISSAEQVANAQQRLGDAQRQQDNQQISSTEQIQNAERSLADAQRQAADQQVQSAEQVAKAKQALIDLEEQQKLSAAAAAASSNQAASMMARDYGRLTPAGKAFVDQVLSMRSSLHLLEADAQSAMLPGFTQMLKDSNKLLPTVQVGVEQTGKAFGNTAIAFGALFANPQFDQAALKFTQLVTGGFGLVMSALPPLLNSIVNEGVRAAPLINAVAVGIHDIIATGLPAFLNGLNSQASDAAAGVGALFHAVSGLLGPVGMLVGAAAGALGPALNTLEPGVIKLVDAVEAGLLPLMPELTTDLSDVAQILNQVFLIAEPIIPQLSTGLGGALRIINPILQETASFLHDNQVWLTPVAEGILLTVAAVKAWNLIQSGYTASLKLATSGLQKLGVMAKTTATAEKEAGEAAGASGMAGKFGNAIPVIGALVTAGMALGPLFDHITNSGVKAATSVDQYTTAMMGTQQAAQLVGANVGSLDGVLQVVGDKSGATSDQMVNLGIAMGKLNQMGIQGGDTLKNYDGALANLVTSGNGARAKQIVDQITSATDAHGKALINTAKDFPQYFAALDRQAAEQATTTQKTQDGTNALGNMGTALGTTADKFSYMTTTLTQTQALDQFHTQLLNLKTSLDQNGTSLDGNTAKGLANRDAFTQAAQQIENYGQQLSQSGVSDGLVATKMQDMVGQLEDTAKQYGYSKQQVDAYVKSIGLIPSSVQTTVTADLAYQVNQSLLQAAAENIGHVVGHYLVPGQATGGLVTGPGTGTSDSVLRRLSAGEFVVPAAATAQIGLAGMEQIRNGQIPQVGGTTPQGSAPVVNLNYYGTMAPTPEQQQVIIRDLTLAVRS